MKKLKFTRNIMSTFCAVMLLTGCNNIPKADDVENSLPSECSIPDGVEVVSMSLNENQEGDINNSPKGYDVTVELNRRLNSGELAIICYAVRDKQINPDNVIAAGFVGVTSADGNIITREDSFLLKCNEDNDVEGAQTISFLEDMNDTSNERSTKIYVQNIEGIRSFLNIPTGIKGAKSNKIRVRCPR